MDTRIVLVEDNPHYRSTLEAFFSHATGFELAAVYGSADSLLADVHKSVRTGTPPSWKMALMDIELPGINGIDATRELKSLIPEIQVVMLTVFEEPATILEAIAAGADGYLLKKSTSKELREQLRSILSGGAPLTSGVARTVLDLLRTTHPVSRGGAPPARLDLTEREQDVLRRLVNGDSYQEAADALGITIHTVRHYIRGVYRKLQVHTVAEAVRRAVRERLV